MRKKTILTLVACVMLVAAAIFTAQAQTGPTAPSGADRGGFGAGMGRGIGRGPAVPPGPPAPVPPGVAMLRPTTEEVEKINAEIKRFIDTNTSANKDLLKKYASLMTVQVPRDNPCIRPTAGGVRAPRHDAFVETAKNGDFDILFHGDSITDWWQQNAAQGGGVDVQKKYFGDIKITNFAVAGDTTQGLLWGLQNGEGQGHKPKAVMLMIGTNNTGGNSGPEIAEGVGAVVHELHKDFPDAKILLLAIFPRGGSANDSNRIKNEEANKIIAKLDDGKHIFFTNINDKFLKPDGSVVGFGGDNLHPNAEGYEIWAKAVVDTLKGWAK
jgi:lysophospholipase L1-like esterase